jgi:HTH-type transcriptional regulator/antitoxin HipB
MDDAFDGAAYVRRVRRLADLSQRELAARTGLSSSAVGRIESGERRLDVGTLSRILDVAGLRLLVVDAQNRPVPPVPRDVLRDHAERHFPSHLDVAGPDDMPGHRGANPRKGKPPAKGWYTLRGRRLELRDRRGTQPDHPTAAGLRRERLERLALGRAAVVEREGPHVEVECVCVDACFEELCLPDCACQCEPDRRHPVRHRS